MSTNHPLPVDHSHGTSEDERHKNGAILDPTLQSSSEIRLRVGEREFRTSKTTLMEGSTYFGSMLSGQWAETEHGLRNAIFIDSDPDTFTHILRFLRTGVFPIFWNRSMGFDFPLYAKLLREAQYFGMESLAAWILRKEYLQAVKVHHLAKQVKAYPESSDMTEYIAVLGGDIERTYYPQWMIEKRYLCPRDIFVHHGNPGRCGRAYEKAKVDGQSTYEDVELVKTLIFETKVVFDYDACLIDRFTPPSLDGEDELL